uniref:Secreted RxLR effector protein 142 n=1 Tax=Plasmopara viticola TaxID=143451 RepID=RL142_PLAVT|nr:RecName: Full=Secreted RxLR effector protein 142; Flags: Precursor [Plasmopara viticola]
MRRAYFVAIALLVAAGGKTAAGFKHNEPLHASSSNFMASVDTVDEDLQSQNLQESRDPKDDLKLSAGNEERTPSALNNFLKEPKLLESIITAGKAMRTEGEANAIEAASKNLNQIESNKRQRIALTHNAVAGHRGHPSPDSDKSLMSVANENPLMLAESLKDQRPTAIMENAASLLKEHDYRLAPPESSTINDKAPDGRLKNQVVTQKAVQLDKNEHVDESFWREELVSVDQLMRLLDEFDKSAHPTTVNRHEESASAVALKSSNQLESITHQRIAPTSNNVIGQVAHAPSNNVIGQVAHAPSNNVIGQVAHAPSSLSPVLVAKNIPSILADRLMKKRPTAIMKNAARYLTQHINRPAPSGPSTNGATTSNGGLNNQLTSQKTFQLDQNKHVGDVKTFWLPTAVDRQSVPEDWADEVAKGPDTFSNDAVNDEVKRVHAAFLEALNLPFHQYPQETAMMLRMVRWKKNAGPNNDITSALFKTLAKDHEEVLRLQDLLGPDLKKLLGDGKMALPRNLKNLQEALIVKLVIMYDLFFRFCYKHEDFVGDLPHNPSPASWILKL